MSAHTITLTPDVAAGIDRFIASQDEKQSRDDAVNALLADWLTQEGLMAPVECPPEVEAQGECE